MTGRKLHTRASLALIFLLGAISFAGPVGALQTEEELEAAKARLASLEAEANAATARYEDAKAELAMTRDEIAEIEAAMSETEGRIGHVQSLLDDRARAAYLLGGTGTLELLLTSTTISDFSDRVVFLDRLAEQDADLVTRLDVLTEELERRQARLAELEQQQAEAAAAAEAELDTIYARLEEAQALRDRLEEELAAERAAAEAAARREAALEPSGDGGGGDDDGGGGGGAPDEIPVSSGGALQACPAPGTSFVDSFGAPRSGGRTHEGVDMMGPSGTPVYAAQSGRVSFSSSELGGNQAHVYASNGDYTFYAHLQSFANVSGTVSAGTQIGTIGDTGNASGSPHLHFEYHPGGGAAVNPYPYVVQVC